MNKFYAVNAGVAFGLLPLNPLAASALMLLVLAGTYQRTEP